MKYAFYVPSLHHACGIARYSCYASDALAERGHESRVLGTLEDLISYASLSATTVFVQHEYGLFEGNKAVHESPSTTEVINALKHVLDLDTASRAAFVLHTLAVKDHVLSCVNKQILTSGIPTACLNKLGASIYSLNHIEHGCSDLRQFVSSIRESKTQAEIKHQFSVGAFGLLSPNKKVEELIDICAEAGVPLVASLATSDKAYATAIKRHAKNQGCDLTLHTSFADEKTILQRLALVDCCLCLQDEIEHYATSGSIRFLMNLGVPIVNSAGKQFADVSSHTLSVANAKEAASTLKTLQLNQKFYKTCCDNVKSFMDSNLIGDVYLQFSEVLSKDKAKLAQYSFLVTGHKEIQANKHPYVINSSHTSDNSGDNSKTYAFALSSHNPSLDKVSRATLIKGVCNPLWKLEATPLEEEIPRWLLSSLRDMHYYTGIILKSHSGTSQFQDLYYDINDELTRKCNSIEIIGDILSATGASVNADHIEQAISLKLGIFKELFSKRPQASLYHSLCTSWFIDEHRLPHYFKIMHPALQYGDSDVLGVFENDNGKFYWNKISNLEQVAAHLMTADGVKCSDLYEDIGTTNKWVERNVFFIEEFLSLDPVNVVKSVKLAFSKEELSKDNENEWASSISNNDTMINRLIFVVENYLHAVHFDNSNILLLASYSSPLLAIREYQKAQTSFSKIVKYAVKTMPQVKPRHVTIGDSGLGIAIGKLITILSQQHANYHPNEEGISLGEQLDHAVDFIAGDTSSDNRWTQSTPVSSLLRAFSSSLFDGNESSGFTQVDEVFYSKLIHLRSLPEVVALESQPTNPRKYSRIKQNLSRQGPGSMGYTSPSQNSNSARSLRREQSGNKESQSNFDSDPDSIQDDRTVKRVKTRLLKLLSNFNNKNGEHMSNFDEASYLERYPDVLESVKRGEFQSGYDHYLKCGFRERRETK
ncbi:hypothetical protein [Cyanobium sp. Morenito 9A2]|uniref:hypothetical protein n=1 Tax=Cyanobium sp. Morenito 9A2 TaxID=2823718 RepID=UPI0020CF496D|nr:hypothetical protein [Cyanobium sp. Morenito 9A2]MCP9848318.1 hypothetical protein [Cyanobium sp. Morenito 9A2]